MRTVLVIRHAHSTANSESGASMTPQDLAFANYSAGLSERGREQCVDLARRLPHDFGINPQRVPVAVSELARTRATAELTGFTHIRPNAVLNESDYDMPLDQLRAMLRENRVPAIALRSAQATLRRPPREAVWITHGLLIAGICMTLGIDRNFERRVPQQCEARWLTF